MLVMMVMPVSIEPMGMIQKRMDRREIKESYGTIKIMVENSSGTYKRFDIFMRLSF